MKDQTDPGSIVSRYEIATILGVTRQGVASVIDHPDFPPPICFIGKNEAPLFYRRAVQAFADKRAKFGAGAPKSPASESAPAAA